MISPAKPCRTRKCMMRPPNLSVHMPRGTRISEPVSTGAAVSRPNWVAFRPSVFLIGMPITPNIIHTMKHTVNANVLTMSTDSACLLFPRGSQSPSSSFFSLIARGLALVFGDLVAPDCDERETALLRCRSHQAR